MLLAPSLTALVLFLPHAAPSSLDDAAPKTKVVEAAVRVTDAGTAEKVEVTAEDQVKLAGTFYAPKATKSAAPGVLLVPDAGSSCAELIDVAEKLQKQGFAVLALDLRGQGANAQADHEWSTLDEEARKTLWAASLGDLKAGIAWLRTRPNVQPSSLSLVGYRTGCTLVARYALRDESVRSIALIDPQPEQYGFNLMKDVEALGGLPTFVAVAKGEQSKAQRLSDSVERGTRSKNDDSVKIFVAKEETNATLSDKRVVPELVKWLAARTAPAQKGRS